jgi:hypothetical protein
MKAKFHLTAEPGLTGFRLRKRGEDWEQPFSSIPQAMRYARSIVSGPSELIIVGSNGREIAHVRL